MRTARAAAAIRRLHSIAEDGEPPNDPSHLKDWLMVRDIRRRLVEAS